MKVVRALPASIINNRGATAGGGLSVSIQVLIHYMGDESSEGWDKKHAAGQQLQQPEQQLYRG